MRMLKMREGIWNSLFFGFAAVCVVGNVDSTRGAESDMVQISASVLEIGVDGESQVIAEPKLVVPMGTWGTFKDGGKVTFPSEFTLPNIPEELAAKARIKGEVDAGQKWSTNKKSLVIPSHPKAFKEHRHGLTLQFRPRLADNGKLVVDCEMEQKVFEGILNTGNPITVEKEGFGGKSKSVTLLQNHRELPRFRTRSQELVFLPTESGHVPKILADSVKPENEEEHAAKIQVTLSAKRLEKLKPSPKKSIPEKVQVYLVVRALESSEEAGVTPSFSETMAPGLPILTDAQFQMWIRKLNQQKGVDLLTAPSIMLRPGQSGKVEVAREFIYPVAYDPPELPADEESEVTATKKDESKGFGFPVTPANPTEFSTVQTGVAIEVMARVLSDGRIELELEPGVTEFKEFINFGKPIVYLDKNALGQSREIVMSDNRMEMPNFQTRSVKTTVRIPDGSTVVLGGLIREDIQDVEDKIPVLGDLPLIGRLGRSQVELHLKRHLYFAVTAQLVDPAGERLE